MDDKDPLTIHSDQIVAFLKRSLQYKSIQQTILQQRIIRKVAQERGIAVDDTAVQQEAERQRRERRLERSSDTIAWLTDQEVTPEDWEDGIRDGLLANQLAEFLFSQDVERSFAENSLDFDRIVLYQIIVPYEPLALELFYEIEEDEISFYEAAHLYDIDESRRRRCGFEGVLYRWSLSTPIASAIFSAQPGQVLVPIHTDAGYHIVLAEEVIKAQLTPEIRQEVMQRMFQEWLQGEVNYHLHNAVELVTSAN